MAEPGGDGLDEAAVRVNVRRLLLVLAGLCVVGLGVGFVAGALHDGGRGIHHPVRAALIGVAVLTLAIGVMALVMWVFLRWPAYRRVMQFGFVDRIRVARAVKAGRPLTAHEIEVAQASRDYLRRFRRTVWLTPLVAGFWLLNGLAHQGTVRWLMIGLAALYLVLAPFAIWQWQRAADRYDDVLSRS